MVIQIYTKIAFCSKIVVISVFLLFYFNRYSCMEFAALKKLILFDDDHIIE